MRENFQNIFMIVTRISLCKEPDHKCLARIKFSEFCQKVILCIVVFKKLNKDLIAVI